MKKFFAIIMSLCLLLSLPACGKNTATQSYNDSALTTTIADSSDNTTAASTSTEDASVEDQTTKAAAKTTKATKATTKTTSSTTYLANFVGKTLGEVKNTYGANYTVSHYQGATVVGYSDYSFLIYSIHTNPSNDIKIDAAISIGNKKLVGNLDGKMTYPEIVAAVGNSVSMIGQPEHLENPDEGGWLYTLTFNYNGYSIMYEWATDPYTTASSYGRATAQQDATTTATKTTEETTKKTTTTTTAAVFITEKKAVSIAEQYWGVKNGDIDPEMGFKMAIVPMESPTADNPTYRIALRWLVVDDDGQPSHYSTLDFVRIDAITGKVLSQ